MSDEADNNSNLSVVADFEILSDTLSHELPVDDEPEDVVGTSGVVVEEVAESVWRW